MFSISLVFRIRSLSLQAGYLILGFPGCSVVKNLPASAGDMNLIPRLGRSPGEGNGNLLQYSCLGNPMARGACWATDCGVTRVGHDWTTEQQQQQQHFSLLPQPPCPPKLTKSQHDPGDALAQRFQKCHVTPASERAAAKLTTLPNTLCPPCFQPGAEKVAVLGWRVLCKRATFGSIFFEKMSQDNPWGPSLFWHSRLPLRHGRGSSPLTPRCRVFSFFNYLFVYVAVSGLSCSTRDTRCCAQTLQLWHAVSVDAVCRFRCSLTRGILGPQPRIEPTSPALQDGSSCSFCWLSFVTSAKWAIFCYPFLFSLKGRKEGREEREGERGKKEKRFCKQNFKNHKTDTEKYLRFQKYLILTVLPNTASFLFPPSVRSGKQILPRGLRKGFLLVSITTVE